MDKINFLFLFSDLLIVEDHTPSPEPQKYKKYGGEWYNQDDMVIKDGPQGKILPWKSFVINNHEIIML